MNPWRQWLTICAATFAAACVPITLVGAWDDEDARSNAAASLAMLWVFAGIVIGSKEAARG